jgi:RimJ/RimL family protein N-acetyltransferase
MFSPKLQRTTKATEAFYLMARHCFEVVGCEVLEWRCDLGNWRSEQAARRFGYYCDGVKEDRGVLYKEFFMIEPDWEVVKEEYERWLNPDNFDKYGNQLTRLEIWPSSI